MKRLAIFAALGGIGYLMVRARLPKLHEQMMAHCQSMMAHCQGMFEQTPGHALRSPCSGGQTPQEVHDAA